MTCHYCGTALPDGALFCGECGQPVGSGAVATLHEPHEPHESPESQVSAPPATGFSIADLAFSSPGETSEPEDHDRELPDGTPLDAADPTVSAAHCPQCGEAMAEGDVFC